MYAPDQMYLTNAQRRSLAARARAEDVSEAEVLRRMAAVDETAGLLADAPDWPEWLRSVRGQGADHRLRELGL